MLTVYAVRLYRGVCPALGFLLRISLDPQGGHKVPLRTICLRQIVCDAYVNLINFSCYQ